MRFIGTYWESGIISRDTSVADNQDIGEQIKRRAQIMDAVADDGAPFDWDSLAFTEAVNFVTGLRIYINDESIRLASHESLDGRIKVIKVLFGAIDFDADANQRVSHERSDPTKEGD